MKHNLLSVLLISSLFSPVAFAQDRAGSFDDRWYLTGGVGANIQDSSRDTENAPTYTLGVGKFINPRWSVDMELNHQNPKLNPNEDLNWSQYGASIDARRHFREQGRTWNPYVLMGVGYGRSEEEFDNFPNPDSPGQRKDGFATAKLGAGVQGDFDRVSLRGELYARTSFDSDSVMNPSESRFTDGVAQLSVVVPIGSRTVAQACTAPEPAPQWQEPATQPQRDFEKTISVELPVVYFEFDRADLSADGKAALDRAADVLRSNAGVRAAIHGHTDSKGSEQYNQGLSDRRAKAAEQYLLSQGVDSSQIVETRGFGESRPAAPNTHEDGSDNPQGRAQNRRTEIKPEQ